MDAHLILAGFDRAPVVRRLQENSGALKRREPVLRHGRERSAYAAPPYDSRKQNEKGILPSRMPSIAGLHRPPHGYCAFKEAIAATRRQRNRLQRKLGIEGTGKMDSARP